MKERWCEWWRMAEFMVLSPTRMVVMNSWCRWERMDEWMNSVSPKLRRPLQRVHHVLHL